MNEDKQDFTINIFLKNPSDFVLLLIALLYIVLICSAFCLVRTIAVYRVNSCFVCISSLCVPISSLRFALGRVRSLHTFLYCIVVHRFYTVSILVGLYVTVAHLIASYWFAPGKQHESVRIRNELIGMLTRWDTNQQELTRIDTMFGDAVRIDFNTQDQYDCFKHFKTILLACGCGRSNTKVTAN